MSSSLELTWEISTTFILAGIEELIKACLVVLFRNTKFRIPSYFLFSGLESIFMTPVVYDHTLKLGAGPVLAVFGTLFVVVSSTSFHVFTSLVYAKARWIYVAIFYCTLVHFASNFILCQIPTLPLYSYIFLLFWPFFLVETPLLFGYYYFERRIKFVRHE